MLPLPGVAAIVGAGEGEVVMFRRFFVAILALGFLWFGVNAPANNVSQANVSAVFSADGMLMAGGEFPWQGHHG
jgi:hypothetical protein